MDAKTVTIEGDTYTLAYTPVRSGDEMDATPRETFRQSVGAYYAQHGKKPIIARISPEMYAHLMADVAAIVGLDAPRDLFSLDNVELLIGEPGCALELFGMHDREQMLIMSGLAYRQMARWLNTGERV